MTRFIFFIIITVLFTFEANAQQFLNKLDNHEQFKKLAGEPLNTNIGNLESVKIVYDLKAKKIYFINSRVYKYHLDFCIGYLNIQDDIESFNKVNYGTGKDRNFLLCNVNFNQSKDQYFIDLSVFDQMSQEYIAMMFSKIAENSFFKERLFLLLNTERLIGLQSVLNKEIKTILPSDIYANQTYQNVSNGRTIGILRFEPNLDSLSKPLHPEDILVTHGTPKYFPNVGGILTDEFQTPLSHLSILGKNRKLPIGVDKLLINDSVFRSFEGKWIEYRVTDRGIEYKLSSPKYRTTNNLPEVPLPLDTALKSIISVENFPAVGAKAIGNKAYNFGLLNSMKTEGKFATPESAYAIPFYFYTEHIQQGRIQELIRLTRNYKMLSDDSLRVLLAELRNEIKKAPIDQKLVESLQKTLSTSEFSTFRFRSSTNAEDAKGFSGAGLYQSKTIDLNDSIKTIEKGIKGVWASLWLYEAFMERRFFNISDQKLAMGVLIHRSFPEEEANGVVITKNVYRPNYKGISVNVQFGDISVVEPTEGVVCDQLVIVYEQSLSGFDRTVEYITSSNQGEGPVLTAKELQDLEFAVEYIKQWYWNKGMRNKRLYYEDFGLDLEFKFQGKERKLYIKQVRYFND